jgi:hypothetical protein
VSSRATPSSEVIVIAVLASREASEKSDVPAAGGALVASFSGVGIGVVLVALKIRTVIARIMRCLIFRWTRLKIATRVPSVPLALPAADNGLTWSAEVVAALREGHSGDFAARLFLRVAG